MSNNDVVVKLSLENKQLARQLADTERKYKRSMKTMEKDTQGFAGSVAKSMRGLAIGATAAAGIIALGRAIKGAVDAADEMGKIAQKVGVTTEALSGLEFAASQAGVEFETLQKALAKVAVDLSSGNSIFGKLGIDAKTADEALVKLADRFQQMPDGLQKTALAAKIFGERIGPGLIPLLNQGSKGITQLTDRAQELGIVISDQMARDAEKFNDTMDEVKRATQGVFLSVSKELLPKMQDMATWMASQDTQSKISALAKMLTDLGTVAVNVAGTIAEAFVGAQDALNVAVNGRQVASQKYLENEIKHWQGMIDRHPIAGKNVKADWDARLAAAKAQLQAYKAAALVWNEPPPPPKAPVKGQAFDFGEILNPTKASKAARASAQAVRDTFMEDMADIGKRISDALFSQSTQGLSEGTVKFMELQRDRMLDLDAAASKYSGERLAQMQAELNGLHDIIGVTYQLEEAERRRIEAQRAGEEAYREHAQYKAEQDAEELARLQVIGDRINGLFQAMASGSDAVKSVIKSLAAELISAIVYAKILMAMGKGGDTFGSTLGSILTGGMGGKSATAPTIRIQNFGGGAVQARQRSNGDVDVLINAVAGRLAAGGSPLDRALATGFGLSRRGT